VSPPGGYAAAQAAQVNAAAAYDYSAYAGYGWYPDGYGGWYPYQVGVPAVDGFVHVCMSSS